MIYFLLFSRHLLYVAESPENPLAKFLYLGTFGETPKEATRPIIILYDVEKVAFTPLKTIPEYYSAGEISWMPGSSGILGVVWPNYPYPAGCPHCANRKSQVQLNWKSAYYYVLYDGHYNLTPFFTAVYIVVRGHLYIM